MLQTRRGGRGRKGRARAARRGGAFKPGGARGVPRLRTAAATSLRVGAAGVCRGGRGSRAGRGVAIATARMEGGGGEEAATGPGGGVAEGPAGLVTEIRAPGPRPLRLLEWKVSVGAAVQIGSVLALCAPLPPAPRPAASAAPPGAAAAGSPRPQRAAAERKLKAERPGVVRELCARPGQVVAPG